MATRCWKDSVIGTPMGEFDLTLTLADDGSFEWCSYNHSYDYGVWSYARGRWQQEGNEIRLQIVESEIQHEWPVGKTVVATITSEGTVSVTPVGWTYTLSP
jgi:hypothetical protein